MLGIKNLALSVIGFLTTSEVIAASIGGSQIPVQIDFGTHSRQHEATDQEVIYSVSSSRALQHMLDGLQAMQDTYFSVYGGTWPDAIDWTAAVMNTHISGTLSSLISGLRQTETLESCTDLLGWDNIINRYFAHTYAFFFGENAFAIRNQAYDDILWVVLDWLENIKFAERYSDFLYEDRIVKGSGQDWHGLQMTPNAAHRARIFYELAEQGWDEDLCGGGMNWNPALEPYKNAITNELFAAASISMYLYYPGDNNTSPFVVPADDNAKPPGRGIGKPHNPAHLENAIAAYKWLQDSHMRNQRGLYQDGWHIKNYTKRHDGQPDDPGTGQCDVLNPMLYTYNQGVLLTAHRGLWLATGARSYLSDGHDLVDAVIRATGWPNTHSHNFAGLGRGGVLEEFCDFNGTCSQDGQTFKGIFFHHFVEFCRPLSNAEQEIVSTSNAGFNQDDYREHLQRCDAYGRWVQHNARAAFKTKDEHGLFGMWWGISPRSEDGTDQNWLDERDGDNANQILPDGAVDYRNSADMHQIYQDEQDTKDNEASQDNTINRRQQGKGQDRLQKPHFRPDPNKRGRGRTVETQSGGLAVLRAQWHWQTTFSR